MADTKLEVPELVGTEAARHAECAFRALYLLIVILASSFATAVVVVVTHQVPWMIVLGILLVTGALVSRWGVRLAREAGAAASSFLSQRLGYPVTIELPRRLTADNWRRQINAAIQVHEATHFPADSESGIATDPKRRRLGEVERRLAELRAGHAERVLAATMWGYAAMLGVAPIVAAVLLIRHLPLWLLLLAVVGLLELAFCEVQAYKRLRELRRSSSELRQLRRERRTLQPPGAS